jgi:hypothetical protein
MQHLPSVGYFSCVEYKTGMLSSPGNLWKWLCYGKNREVVSPLFFNLAIFRLSFLLIGKLKLTNTIICV